MLYLPVLVLGKKKRTTEVILQSHLLYPCHQSHFPGTPNLHLFPLQKVRFTANLHKVQLSCLLSHLVFYYAAYDVLHNCLTLVDTLRGCPFVASKQISEQLLVQNPSPTKNVSDFRFYFIQLKAQVLYLNPQLSITERPSLSCGKVTHKNNIASPAVILFTGILPISSIDIV